MPPRNQQFNRGERRSGSGPRDRGFGIGGGNQNSRNQRGGRGGGNDFEAMFMGGLEATQHKPWHPTTNSTLRDSRNIIDQEYRGNLGFSAHALELQPNKLKIEIDPSDEVLHNSRVDIETLTDREDLAVQALHSKKIHDGIRLEGTLSPEIVTALVVDLGKDKEGNALGQTAGVFRQADLDSLRGEAGPSGMLDDLPGIKSLEEVNDECFMIGRRGKDEVIIGVAGHGDGESQRYRISRAKNRILGEIREQLSVALGRGDTTLIKELNHKIADIMHDREVIILSPEKAAEQDAGMQRITTKINGHEESINGYARIDTVRKTVTVAKPVTINPKAKGIDPTSLRVLDGTGRNRDFHWVRGNEKSLAPIMRQALRGMRGPQLVQRSQKGELILPPPSKQAQLLLNPYAVPFGGR